jgi:hypothetical protein
MRMELTLTDTMQYTSDKGKLQVFIMNRPTANPFRLPALILFSLLSAIALNSCCKDMVCPDFDGFYNIQFHGYDRDEIDSVVVLVYNRNSAFTDHIDSFLIITQFPAARDEFDIVWSNEVLIPGYDYRIIIPATGESFTLNDFVLKKETCRGACSTYMALKSYRLNGEIQTGSLIISRPP